MHSTFAGHKRRVLAGGWGGGGGRTKLWYEQRLWWCTFRSLDLHCHSGSALKQSFGSKDRLFGEQQTLPRLIPSQSQQYYIVSHIYASYHIRTIIITHLDHHQADGVTVCLWTATRGRRLYFSSEGNRAENFYRPRPSLNRRNFDPMASTLTNGPPRTTNSLIQSHHLHAPYHHNQAITNTWSSGHSLTVQA
jgi:hypothetical protein